jgi:hypothetical protein
LATAGFAGEHAFRGKETIKIFATKPGPRHAKVTARGAFTVKGYFVHHRAWLVFPKGRLAVHRKVVSTSYSPPNLSTCRFKTAQSGTFRVFYATGRYKGLRYSGQYWTDISGRLKKSGPNQCTSKIVVYRAVTYEVGTIP